MWVADMDFQCCPEVLDALSKKVQYGVLGYTKNDSEYFEAIRDWHSKHFHVTLEEDWLIPTPGVVFALATAVKTITKENDYVIVTNPVYYPFTEIVVDNKRKIIDSPLILNQGHYEIDFEDFEHKIKKYQVKLFLLCSPHNPVGRVWSYEELEKIIEICKKYDVFIVSDEIHSDFIWKGVHTCLLKYEDYLDKMIVCTSPSKTFNLAGLQVSNIFIPNKTIREKFQLELWNTGYSLINVMGLVACEAAYTKGEIWLQEVKNYLQDNIDYVGCFVKEKLPKIKLIYPEGTYLLWLDFRQLNLDDERIEDIMIHEAKIWLDSGKVFGESGKGFQRINIALPRKKLEMALKRIEKAFKNY